MKVWKNNHGPFHKSDLDDPNPPEEVEYMIVALVEVEGKLYDQELWFDSWDDVQGWVMHFASKIDPIEVRV